MFKYLNAGLSFMRRSIEEVTRNRPLEKVRHLLYEIAGGSIDSANPRIACLATEQRISLILSPEFCNWVDYEKSRGRIVLWIKDLDMTQTAGETYPKFFTWRTIHNKFSEQQLQAIKSSFLPPTARLNIPLSWVGWAGPQDVIRLWQNGQEGREEQLSSYDLWAHFYWPSQVGMTKQEKLSQVAAFASTYGDNIYPGVFEENIALNKAGVTVVIISKSDEELVMAIAPYLGVHPNNVGGSPLLYGEDGRALGLIESLVDDKQVILQLEKIITFRSWIERNKKRWGWNEIDDRKIVIAGYDGDTAPADGSMMILLPSPALGNFMVNTPGMPGRIEEFYSFANQHAWKKGQYITLNQLPAPSSKIPV